MTAPRPDDTETNAIIRVCWAYYREGLTQEQIAERLGLTRKRVIQMLAEGRSTGLVHISVRDGDGVMPAMEQDLRDRFGLHHAIVAPRSLASDTDVRGLVGAALGDYLSNTLRDGDRIGLGWGGTIHAATRHLHRGQLKELTVVQLLGGLARQARFNPFDNVSRFAAALEAECYYLPAPMLADTLPHRDMLMSSRSMAQVVEQSRALDLAILTAVDMTEQSGGLEYGVLTREEWESLRAAGAVGDICGHYLSAEGEPIDHPVAQRTIHIPFDTLRTTPSRVLAAGGKHKTEIVRAALKAGLATVLITEESLAVRLL